MVKGKTYKFYISNFQKGGILYTRGMKPYIYSEKAKLETGKDWEQSGNNLKYERKLPKIAKISKFEYC